MIEQANEILVSIILPVYNGEKFLKQSIESVLSQTHKNLELIIVNDCSTDNSLSIANSFAKQDQRVKIYSNQVNQKLPESLNIGFRNAKGDYYTWTSDDNWYEPTAIEDMLNYLLENKDKVMVCADESIIYEEDHTQDHKFVADPSPQGLMESNKCGACFLWPKETATLVGEYDKNRFLVEDYDYWLRVGLIGEIGHLQKNLYNYRMHKANLTSKNKDGQSLVNRLKENYCDAYKKKYPSIKVYVKSGVKMANSKNFELSNNLVENLINTENTVSESNTFIRRLLKKASMPNGIFRKDNIRFYLPNYPRDKSQTQLVDHNNYNEAFALEAIECYLKKDAVIVDIGAFIGNHALYWAINNNAKKVYAYEPLLENYKILRRNIKINKLKKVVIPQNIALGDKEGLAVVSNYSTLDMAATTFKNEQLSSKNGNYCKFSMLDSQTIEETKIDLLKIDTNGSEFRVLQGGLNFIKKYKPSIIYIDTLEQFSLDECTRTLQNLNYEILHKLPGLRLIFSLKDNNSKEKKLNNLEHYQAAKKWVENNTIENQGIAVTSDDRKIYPEVTGYFIPTLLKFGDRKRAINFGNYLISIQNDDGSWSDADKRHPYTFDTGMILKGLLELIKLNLSNKDKYIDSFIKGADWIFSQQRNDGSIGTPDKSAWGLANGKQIPEGIHIYALSAIKEFANTYNKYEYLPLIDKAINFYLADKKLTEFNTLSHFNAYIIEGLIDLGCIDLAKSAMSEIEKYQKEDGSISAYSDVDFVCSTGMFQYAICWFKLGNIKCGKKTFDYASKLQNPTGGWYGSYGVNSNYIPTAEISWAVKYYLDAIYYMQLATIMQNEEALASIDENDGKFLCVKKIFEEKMPKEFLDLGCGKARYSKKIIDQKISKGCKFYGVDLKANIMKNLPDNMEAKEGSILAIPYTDNKFDFVFLSESMEHAIDIDNALEEIRRVMKKEGTLVIIDKEEEANTSLSYIKAPFEQWFKKNDFINQLSEHGFKAYLIENLKQNTQLKFNCWVANKI